MQVSLSPYNGLATKMNNLFKCPELKGSGGGGMHNYYKQMNLDVKQCIYVYVSLNGTENVAGDHDVKYAVVNTLTYEQVKQIAACL